jgi:mannose-6-phosphate isomerase-like protein (cupin superfamily)
VQEGVYVPAGGDRFREHREVFGTRRIDYKVSTPDMNGGLFISEIVDDHKGGPSRHLHYEQDEWFYVIEGEYSIEVGDEKYRLGPGDSVLAPRMVPHVWAHVGEGTGKLIAAVQPAGKLEAFFGELAKMRVTPSREVLLKLFRAHGMELAGPPLGIE